MSNLRTNAMVSIITSLITAVPLRSRSLRKLPDTAQTSRGTSRLRRTPAGFTTPDLDGYGLRGHWPARPTG